MGKLRATHTVVVAAALIFFSGLSTVRADIPNWFWDLLFTWSSGVSVEVDAAQADVVAMQAQVDALTAEVSQLEARAPGIGVTAGGEPVGRFISFDHSFGVNSVFVVMSDKGYVFVPILENTQGTRQPGDLIDVALRFQQSGCTGQASVHVANDPWVFDKFPPSQGFVFRLVRDGNTYYIPAGSQIGPAPVMSQAHNDGTCTERSGGSEEVFLAYPNDPEITGVPDGRLPLPIMLVP